MVMNTILAASIIIDCDENGQPQIRVTDGAWKSIGAPRTLFLQDGTAIMTAVFLCPGGRTITTEIDNGLN